MCLKWDTLVHLDLLYVTALNNTVNQKTLKCFQRLPLDSVTFQTTCTVRERERETLPLTSLNFCQHYCGYITSAFIAERKIIAQKLLVHHSRDLRALSWQKSPLDLYLILLLSKQEEKMSVTSMRANWNVSSNLIYISDISPENRS